MGSMMADNGGRLLGLYDEVEMFLSQINVFHAKNVVDSHEQAVFLQLYGGSPLSRKTDVMIFFSRCICQDPLEKFFGCQRQIGTTHDNPNVKEFQQNTQTLRVVVTVCRGSVKSNCRENDNLNGSEYNTQPLQKRRKKIDSNMTRNTVTINASTTITTISDDPIENSDNVVNEDVQMCEVIIKGFASRQQPSYSFDTTNESLIKAANTFIQWQYLLVNNSS
uniref:Transposable element P transposase-like RNase H C-terminal domain-containing protein n=1 Tax=Amphimedon queenslandica TaxID=400682 RepID=A0A1X7VB23_AMPQE